MARYKNAWALGRLDLVRPGRVPAVGVRRRIQALYALGWPEKELAARLGYRYGLTWMYHRRPTISAVTARRVAALYEQLCMTPGPSARTRARAAAAGHRPPLWWDDIDHDPDPAGPAPAAEAPDSAGEVDASAVQRLLAGDPPAVLRRVDRRAAVAVLLRQGISPPEISRRTGLPVAGVRHDQDVLRSRA
ncbi:hypothetical protein [Saccharopolyspora cebuensis]|uniref:hypothetical protein n=1 Tax=Saccharopolyspora cebuensis TaxID=418759 RepID=UPI0031EE4827